MRSTRLSDPSFIYFTPTCFIPISVPTCKHPFSTCAFVDLEGHIKTFIQNSICEKYIDVKKKKSVKKKYADC